MPCKPEKNCCEKEKVPLPAFRALIKKVDSLEPQLIPEGGTDGQSLVKTGNLDFEIGWETIIIDWSALTGKPSTFPPSTHTHSISQVTGLTTALNGKANTSHGHTMSDVSGLSAALAGKAPVVHGHTIAQVSGLQASLDGKEPALVGYTVATLPAGAIGDMAYVTDATTPAYNTALTGGGAVVVPVFFNGTIWVSH